MKTNVRNMCIAAVSLALCMLLPFLTGQIPQIGSALSPMHIPVLLCGLLAGWQWGLLIGAVSPLLRFLLFQMPPIMPTGLAMCFELAGYGVAAGILVSKLPKKLPYLYVSLVIAMLAGRLVWGTARYVIGMALGEPFTFQAFLAGAFLNAIPGIICHIILIPPIVAGVRKTLREQ